MFRNQYNFTSYVLFNVICQTNSKIPALYYLMHSVIAKCFSFCESNLNVFLQRSRCRSSRTGDGFCQQGHQRAAQWKAFPETWLSWVQSVQWQAMSEKCTPSRANWPGTLHCDSPEDSTRHPRDMQRTYTTLFSFCELLCLRAWHRRATENCHTLNCCCVTLLLSGFRNSSTWGIRSLQQKL